MNNAFSYVDNCLRLVHLNITANSIEEQNHLVELFKRLETSTTASSNELQKLFYKELNENQNFKRVINHEYYHYWQSIYYPYLYILNAVELLSVLRIEADFQNVPFKEISCGNMKDSNRRTENFYRISTPFWLCWSNNELAIHDIDKYCEGTYVDVKLDLRDLIEDVTSIYEYKQLHNEWDGINYAKWLRRPQNRAYKKLYKFVEKIVGQESAFNMLPSLVQASFYTTRPEQAFCLLFNFMVNQFQVSQDNPYKKVPSISTLKQVIEFSFPSKEFLLDEIDHVSQIPFTYLSDEYLDSLVDFEFKNENYSFKANPLAYHFGKYRYYVQQSNEYERLLTEPYEVDFLLNEFAPCIVVSFSNLSSKQTFLYLGKDFRDTKFMQRFARDILLFEDKRNTILSLLTNINEDRQLRCAHIQCTYYEFGLCRQWNAIPDNYMDCVFPVWFEKEFGFRIDTKDKLLRRMNNDEVQSSLRKVINFQKPTTPEFIKENNTIKLIVTDSTIAEDPHGETLENLFQTPFEGAIKPRSYFLERIQLNFDFFSSQNSLVFEDKAVCEWIKLVKSKTPDLLLFLNAQAMNLNAIIFPILIQYKKESENGKAAIYFSQEKFREFWLCEAVRLMGLCDIWNYDKPQVSKIINKQIDYAYTFN